MAKATKLPSGSWRVKVYMGKKDGKNVYASVTAATKKEAEYKAARLSLTKRHGEDPSFLNAAERYIDSKSKTLSPNTLRGYNVCLKRLEDLYSVRLSRISSEMVQRIINKMDLSPKTIKNTYGFFTAVIEMFDPDLKYHVTLPERQPKQSRIPTDNEVIALVNAANEELSVAIQLAAYGSLRSGEVCALFPDCVFDDHITIKRVYAKLDKEWILKDSPKTKAGYRDIPLPGPVIARIRALKTKDGQLFHYRPQSLYDAFRRLTRRLDMYPYRFHDLRHYFATMCHAKNIPDKYIAKLGGWEDIGTLQRIYQHTMPEKMDDVVDILNKSFFEKYSTEYSTK